MSVLTKLWIKRAIKIAERAKKRAEKAQLPEKKRKILLTAMKQSPIEDLDKSKLTKTEKTILDMPEKATIKQLTTMNKKIIKAMMQYIEKNTKQKKAAK